MNKKSSILCELKQYCIDKLWFVILLTPLFIIAVVMFNHFKPAEKQLVNPGLALTVGGMQISTAELSAIVAKPLTELLVMEVYSVVIQSAAVTNPVKKAEFRQARNRNVSEIRPVENYRISVVSYAITEKTKRTNMREAF